MSLNRPEEKCVVCNAYIFEDDDIVYCPSCGAPHHRECYDSIGHCALEDLHGTDKQYKKPEPKIEEPHIENDINLVSCGMCGEKYDKSFNNCPKCNAPNFSRAGGRFINFDFLGGIPAEMDLGKDVTADEAKRFVMTNTQRYIPKFAGFVSGKKTSWNWLAFLFPCGWMMSRKMYLLGAITGALQLALTFLTFPFINVLGNYEFVQTRDYFSYISEISDTIIKDIDKIGIWVIIAAGISVLLSILLCIIVGMFGDRWYKTYVVNNVKTIKDDGEDIDVKFRKSGGVNLLAGLLGIMAINYIPRIMMVFI